MMVVICRPEPHHLMQTYGASAEDLGAACAGLHQVSTKMPTACHSLCWRT